MKGQNDWRRSDHSGQRRPQGQSRPSGNHGGRARGQNRGSRGAQRAEDDWPGSEREARPDWSGEQEMNRSYEDDAQYGGPSMYGQYGGPGYGLDDDQNEREIGGQGYLGGYDMGGNRYGGNSLYGGGTTGQMYGGRTAMRGGQGYMGGYGLRPFRGSAPGGQKFPRGPKGYTRSDERIREDLCDRLMGSSELDSSDVEVNVKDGEVTLTGTVPDRDTKHHIERLADTIAGVNDINNQLKVKRAKSSAR